MKQNFTFFHCIYSFIFYTVDTTSKFPPNALLDLVGECQIVGFVAIVLFGFLPTFMCILKTQDKVPNYYSDGNISKLILLYTYYFRGITNSANNSALIAKSKSVLLQS